jgi:uncharacterized protein YkwD
MGATGHFAHLNLDGVGPQERSRRAGYRGAVLENLAWGQKTEAEVIAAWLESPAHCQALFSPSSNEVGAGLATGTGEKRFWTLLLGTKQ